MDLSLAQAIMPLAGMLGQARTWRLSNRNSRISPLDRLSTFLTGILGHFLLILKVKYWIKHTIDKEKSDGQKVVCWEPEL